MGVAGLAMVQGGSASTSTRVLAFGNAAVGAVSAAIPTRLGAEPVDHRTPMPGRCGNLASQAERGLMTKASSSCQIQSRRSPSLVRVARTPSARPQAQAGREGGPKCRVAERRIQSRPCQPYGLLRSPRRNLIIRRKLDFDSAKISIGLSETLISIRFWVVPPNTKRSEL